MVFKGFQFSVQTSGSGSEAAEASLKDSAIFSKENVTLEEKITLLFEAQSEAVFCFLAAVFGNSDI